MMEAGSKYQGSVPQFPCKEVTQKSKWHKYFSKCEESSHDNKGNLETYR